jgi:acetyl-CoA carboxylase biotin carboxyl carrier protein
MSPDEIALILDAIHKLDCAAVEVTVGDVRIVMRRDAAGEMPLAAPAPAARRAALVQPAAAAASRPAGAAAPAVAVAPAPAAAQGDLAQWLEREAQGTVCVIRAPMIGTFYRAKSPGEPPFVELGAEVSKGDTLGLIEAMKLFNSMMADGDGKVLAILSADGEMVEYEQPVLVLSRP